MVSVKARRYARSNQCDRYFLIDVGKKNSVITCLVSLGYVGRIRNRDLFGIKVIYRYGYQNACPCKCILAIGSIQNAIGEPDLPLQFSFVACASRVSPVVFPFPSRAPVITHGVITYREHDKKK